MLLLSERTTPHTGRCSIDFWGCAQDFSLLEADGSGGAWMDVTACRALFGSGREIAARISTETAKRLGLPLSIGCSSNKLVSRIASGMGMKFVRVLPGSEAVFIANLPITALDAVNPKIERRLTYLGISKIGQLAEVPEAILVRQFGVVGHTIKMQSTGLDFSPVEAAYPPEVINSETTFSSSLDEPAQVEQHLSRVAGEMVEHLKKKNALAGEVTLTLFDDSKPPAIPAYFRFKKPTASAFVIMQALSKLVSEKMQAGMEISRVRVVLSDLSPGDGQQLSLVENSYIRDRVDTVVEMLKHRFGDDAIFRAASLTPSLFWRAST